MGNKTTTKQRADPWKPAQPGLEQGIERATSLFDQGGFQVDPFQGQMVAEYDPFRANADAMVPGTVAGNMSGIDAARQTAAGMMDPNLQSDAFGQTIQNTIADIMPGINGSFAKSGMTGSTLHEQNLASGLGQGVADIYDRSFWRGQDNALTAAGMMPGFNNAATGQVDWMRGVGAERQQHEQQKIMADIVADQQGQAAPMAALQDYMALMSGVGGQFGTKTDTQQTQPGVLSWLSFLTGLGG